MGQSASPAIQLKSLRIGRTYGRPMPGPHLPLRAFAANTALLHAAEGSSRIGHEAAIEPDHAEVEFLRDALAAGLGFMSTRLKARVSSLVPFAI